MKRLIIPLFAIIMTCQTMHAQNDSIKSIGLNEITVTGTRKETEIRNLPVTISVINRQQLSQENNLNILPSVSQYVPGVFVTDRGILGYGVSTNSSGSIKIRGIGSMANMLVLIDGLPQYAGLYGHPIADVYQTMMAEKVEVLRGPASMIYGSNAMGGVLNIVTRRMQEQGFKTDISLQGGSYGTFEGNVINRFRKDKFSSILGFNYGRTDGHRKDMDFDQFSGFIKLSYDINKFWNLNSDVNISHFNSQNPGEISSHIFDNIMHVTRGMAALNLVNDYKRTSGAVRIFYNWGHHKINDGYKEGGTPRTNYYLHDDLMGGVSIYQSASLFKGNTLTLGFDYQHFGGNAWNEPINGGDKTVIIDKTQDETAAYADFRQILTSYLTVDAGIRIDNHSQSGTQIIPQGGLTLLLPYESELRAVISKGFRNPTIRELYMYAPANDKLKAEKLMNYELSYKQRLLNNRLRYGLNVFYLKADNLIETAMIDGKPRNINTGEIENWGIEGEIFFNLYRNLNINANYSYLHMKNPLIAAPEHKFYLGGHYKIKDFTITSGWQYVAGLYTTVGSSENKENFLLWNMNLDYRIMKGLHVFVKGENLLDRKYEINYGFPMPGATFMAGINTSF